MKPAFILLFALFTGFGLYAQELKKIGIGELTETIRKSDHPLVISFWATWCAPCVEEIPHLQAAVKEKAAKKVELLLVSLDFASYYPKKITDFITQKNFNASFFWLNETNADLFCPRIDERWTGAIPATLFVNGKTGHRKFFERQLNKEEIKNAMDALVQ
jgi:thiol-disulfide isomerase/thioredoxin